MCEALRAQRGTQMLGLQNTDLISSLPAHTLWQSPLWSGESDLLSHVCRSLSSLHSLPMAPVS